MEGWRWRGREGERKGGVKERERETEREGGKVKVRDTIHVQMHNDYYAFSSRGGMKVIDTLVHEYSKVPHTNW